MSMDPEFFLAVLCQDDDCASAHLNLCPVCGLQACYKHSGCDCEEIAPSAQEAETVGT